jgi:crossover junction endodeoxyribonuclease RuvC
MPSIVGVDPGVSPTVCILIDDPGKPLAVEFYDKGETSYETIIGGSRRSRPSASFLRTIFANSLASLVVIEDVHSMPKQGLSSTFAFGYASGMIEGVACALQLPVLRVLPTVWKKAYRIQPKSNKGLSRHVASNLAPHLADEFTKIWQHDRAEAFLMAYWGRSQINKQVHREAA